MEAEIIIKTDSNNLNLFEGLDLPEYFITSKVNKILSDKKGELKIEVKKADGTKCSRCWKILESTCQRCANAI